jgi:transcriptional regulator with XRE-family HTH domain
MVKQQKIFLAANIKFLRQWKNKSQEDLAAQLGMSRVKLSSYENGIRSNMPNEDLINVADYFKISVDALLKNELSKLGEFKLKQLQSGNDVFITGSKLRILATTVDSNNIDNIEVVPIKARAGYAMGFFDPAYVESLPKFQLPIITNRERKYRMFQIDGESMLPIPDKSYVLAEYIENWNDIKDEYAYIILTKNDGIVFKIVLNQIKKQRNLLLRSLNPLFKDYEVNISDVQEVWKFVSYISNQLPEGGLTLDKIGSILKEVKSEVRKIRNIEVN